MKAIIATRAFRPQLNVENGIAMADISYIEPSVPHRIQEYRVKVW